MYQITQIFTKNNRINKWAEKLDQYQWSSHKGYVSKAKKWNWLHKGLNKHSSVSSVIERIKQKLQKNKKFKKRIEKINTILTKGQEEI